MEFFLENLQNKLNNIHEFLRLTTNDNDSNFNEILESSHELWIHKTCINYLMIEVYEHLHGITPELIIKLTISLFGKIVTSFTIFVYLVRKPAVSAFWSGCNNVSCYSIVTKSTHSNKRFSVTRNFQSKSEFIELWILPVWPCKRFIANVGYIKFI